MTSADPPAVPPTVELPTTPAEPRLTENVSLERIAAIRSSTAAANAHRILGNQLLVKLEELGGTTDRERIRVATQELADRLYLLALVVQKNHLEHPGSDRGHR